LIRNQVETIDREAIMSKILVIDDKQDNLITMSAILKGLLSGCQVITAQSGREGIEKATACPPDTILLDIIMPGMDGYTVCKKLKEAEGTKQIPVIMISAIKKSSEDLVKGLETGADAYLAKPVDEYALIAQVNTALRIKKAEDLLRKQKDQLEYRVQERTVALLTANMQLKNEIEERKQAEKALRENEARLRTIVDSIRAGVMVIDVETRTIIYANTTATEIIGALKEQLVGQVCHEYICPEEKGKCPILDLGEKIDHSERILIKANGERIPILKTGTPVLFDGKKCLLHSFSELTDKKNLEAQLYQAQRMEAIGTLSGGVAHDFNNLLTSILGNAELGLMTLDKDAPLYEELQEIVKAGNSAASLTRQLLAFSRKQILQPMVLDLNTVTQGIEKMLRRTIGEDVALTIWLEPDLDKVMADPGQIEQVLMNLAVNARDAMPQGGKLTVETANVYLGENYFRDHGVASVPGPYVKLIVSDTGKGLDPKTQFRIFEPFFTTKGPGKGTGLGLSTVYGIIKQSSGYIWAYSEPGQGAIFEVFLPRAKEGVAPEKKERTVVTDFGGSETVLIVEDDDSLRKLAHKVLQQKGYTILAADNGEDALGISKEHEGAIDLMLTDVVMPRMSGRETAKLLKPLYPQMKVIYMSGYTDEAIVNHGVLSPGLNFIEKPFTPDALAGKVREVLGRK